MGIFDSEKVDITCPSCRRKRSESLGKLKTNPKLTCICGTVIDVDARKLTAGLQQAEKSLANLGKAFGKLGK